MAKVGIQTAFSHNNTERKHVVNPKDPIFEMEKTGILYKYKCQDCDHVYVVETERTIQVRAKRTLWELPFRM